MAKTKIDTALLAKIAAATTANELVYVSQVESQPLVSNNPPLIEVNTGMTDPNDGTRVAARATADGLAMAAGGSTAASAPEAGSSYQIITGATVPPSKRRGGNTSGAPTKYPFANLEVGQSFFEPNSNHKKGDAVKALGSTVSSQNNKYSEDSGETKTVTRAVRGEDNKAKLDEAGNKITETVTLPVKRYNRKFIIRAVEAGKSYGGFTATADGALISRTV